MAVLQEVETRFLYPFLHDLRRSGEAVERLTSLLTSKVRGDRQVWKRAEPHELYRQELLDNVSGFLFPKDPIGGCKLLEVDRGILNSWFRSGIRMSTAKDELLDPGVVCRKIEVFLSPFGAGVLSITLQPSLGERHTEALDASVVKDFNYHGAQLRGKIMPRFSIPHPQAGGGGKIASELPPPPPADAPLSERLGVTGGVFNLGELREFLLAPIAPREVQSQFSVYSVVHLDESVSFDSDEKRRILAPVLAGLAQIEERLHAGAPEGEINVPNRVLNSRHWAAVSFLGAAHLVADQGVPFDGQRAQIVLDKYFVPYLAAFLQRLTTQRIIGDAQAAVISAQTMGPKPSSPPARSSPPIADLRLEMLSFAVCSNFTEISSRESLNRFYDLSREGLRANASLAMAKEAIVDFDASEMNKTSGRNLEIVAAVQTKIEWLEVFFVSFYAAELSELVGKLLRFDHDYQAWTVPGWMIGAGLFAVLSLRPWKHSAGGHSEEVREFPLPLKLFVLAVAAAIVWVGFGLRGRAPLASENPGAEHRPP